MENVENSFFSTTYLNDAVFEGSENEAGKALDTEWESGATNILEYQVQLTKTFKTFFFFFFYAMKLKEP